MVGNLFFKGVDEKIGRQKQEQIEEKETLAQNENAYRKLLNLSYQKLKRTKMVYLKEESTLKFLHLHGI